MRMTIDPCTSLARSAFSACSLDGVGLACVWLHLRNSVHLQKMLCCLFSLSVLVSIRFLWQGSHHNRSSYVVKKKVPGGSVAAPGAGSPLNLISHVTQWACP